MSNKFVTQAVVVVQNEQNRNQPPMLIALFNQDGTPYDPSGGGLADLDWDSIVGKPAVIAAGATAADARQAIGAGTGSSNLAVGTTVPSAAGTAAAGTSGNAARADHVHPRQTGAQVTLTGYTAGTAGSVAAGDSANAAIAKLEARIVALETP